MLKSLALALAFWLFACILFLASGCTHHPDCLCRKCELAYYQEREK